MTGSRITGGVDGLPRGLYPLTTDLGLGDVRGHDQVGHRTHRLLEEHLMQQAALKPQRAAGGWVGGPLTHLSVPELLLLLLLLLGREAR